MKVLYLYFTSFLICFTVSSIHHRENFTINQSDLLQAEIAIELLRMVNDGQDSTVLSPLAISLILTTIKDSSRNDEQTDSRESNYRLLLSYLTSVQDDLSSSNSSIIYQIRNLLVASANSNETLVKCLESQPHFSFLNFTLNESTIVEDMNKWLSSEVDSDLHFENDFPNVLNTTSLLINFAFLKGNWKTPFSIVNTFLKDFYKNETIVEKVEMMSIWAFSKYHYTEDVHTQVVGIPYEDNETFLYIFLPRMKYGLADLLNKLDGAKILKLIARSTIVDIEVEIPRFRIETKYELKFYLPKIGMINMNEEELAVQSAFHTSIFEVAESGTGSANAALPRSKNRFQALWQGGHLKFIADHPFLFYVFRQKTILFIGRFS